MADRYYAHAPSGHGHTVEAASFADAALAFTEAHAAWAEDDALQVFVRAEDGGPEHCFVVHLDGGSVEACG